MTVFHATKNITAAGNLNNAVYGEKIVDVVKGLPHYFEHGKLCSPSPKEINPNTAFDPAFSLIYPDFEDFLAFQIVCIQPDPNEMAQFTSLFPRLNHIGLTYSGYIRDVYHQIDSAEALSKLTMYDLEREIIFFDMDFVKQRDGYFSDKEIQAVIYGIAIDAELSESQIMQTVTIDNPETAKALGIKAGDTIEVDAGPMRACFPRGNIKEEGYQFYEFRGKVHAVRAVELSLIDEKGWVCTVDIFRNGDDDNEFSYDEDSNMSLCEIYIPQHLWKETTPPKIDDFIVGFVTFCGFVQ